MKMKKKSSKNSRNQNYNYIGKTINNMIIVDVFYEERQRKYVDYPVRIYYAVCKCINCGYEKTFTMKYLKEHVLKNDVKEDFYCEGCGNFKESSSYKRVCKNHKNKENG